MTPRLRLLLAAGAIALVGLIPATDASAAEPGVVLTGSSYFESPQTLDAVHRAGAGWVRMYLYRDQVEIAPGVLNRPVVAAYQRAVQRYLFQGVKTEIVLVGTPRWESGSDDPLAAPDPAGFAAFARQISSQLPNVGAYEVWNEADAVKWWHPGPDAAAYAALLRAVYPALKEGSGGADVIMGGLTGNDYAFLDEVYANGGGGSFDGVSVHTNTACGIASPYAFYRDESGRVSRWSFLGYREVLATMDAHGDTAKPVWFTEFGWSTSGATCDQGVWAGQKAGGVSEADQATYLAQAWHCVAGDARVRGMFWFDVQDLSADGSPDHSFGLLHADGSAKPAFAQFADLAANGDRLTGPCGDFGGPAISLLALGDHGTTGRHAGALRVKVKASDPQSVTRISYYLDGKKVRSFRTGSGPEMTADYRISAARRLRGKHELTVEAADANGNVTKQTFTITKSSPSAAKKRKRR